MAEPKVPSGLTPYILGLGVLTLIAIFSLMASVPWAGKTDIEHIRAHIRGEIEWLKDQNQRIQKHLELIEAGRDLRAVQINDLRAGVADCNRRIQRLEDLRPARP
jgi:hypothetical protein